MVQKGLPGAAEQTGKFRPRVRGAHINDAHGFDPWLRRFNPEEARRLTALDTTPELPLRGDNKVLVEGISMGGDYDPLTATSYYREDRCPGGNDPHIMLQLRHVLLGGCFFRE